MSVVAKIYTGCYGGENNNKGDLITCVLKCESQIPSLDQKQIIFVVDTSGSMVTTLPTVKASLFAARNSLLRLMGYDLSSMSEETRDESFSKICKCCLITFSDQATCQWESHTHDKSFTHAVSELSADASTNMGDGLYKALEHKIPEYMTWIILLTDGISNKGPCQTVRSFQELARTLPPKTKIIPMGYTTNFDPDVLSALGIMTYIESEESISEIMGNITAEIATCYGIEGQINLPNLSELSPNPDDLIHFSEETKGTPREVIGSKYIGCLFNDRNYIYGYLPWGDTFSSHAREYIGLCGNVEYYDLPTQKIHTIFFVIEDGSSEVPDMIRESYFAASKSRIMLDIYMARQHRRYNSHYLQAINKKLNDWTHPLALSHKEEIKRILDQNHSCVDRLKSLSSAYSTRDQTSYSTGRYTTPIQRSESLLTTREVGIYIQL